MTGCEDPGFADLDAYIRTQLARAAETYALRVDIDARLKAIFGAGTKREHEDTSTADS